MKDLGIIFVLLGVICLVVYAVTMPVNWLLVLSLGLEVLGVILYIILNRFLK